MEILDQIDVEIGQARKWEHYFEPVAVVVCSLEWRQIARHFWPEQAIATPDGQRRYRGLPVFIVSADALPLKRVLLAERVQP